MKFFTTHKILLRKAWNGDEPAWEEEEVPEPTSGNYAPNVSLWHRGIVNDSSFGSYHKTMPLREGTPEWKQYEDLIRQRVGPNATLHDFVRAHIPNVNDPRIHHNLQMQQMMNTTTHDPNQKALDVVYRSTEGIPNGDREETPDYKATPFEYDARYHANEDGTNHLKFGEMYNKVKQGMHEMDGPDISHKFLPGVISNLGPFLKQHNVDSIRTEAVSNGGKMNGGDTWQKLGFGFDPEHFQGDERSKFFNTLSGSVFHHNKGNYATMQDAHKHSAPELERSLGHYTHPFQIKNGLEKLGVNNVPQVMSHAMKNARYHAKLNLKDENDPGLKVANRMFDIINRRSNKPQALETPKVPEPVTASQHMDDKHRHSGYIRETFPDFTEEEEREILELMDALHDVHESKHHNHVDK